MLEKTAPLAFSIIMGLAVAGCDSERNRAPLTTTAPASTAPSTTASTPVPAPPPGPVPITPTPASSTPPNFTVAFIGDAGILLDARAVLNLIKNEGADCVVHQGDFDYLDQPWLFEDMVNGILGADFPYFASPGNHDLPRWHGPLGYRARFEERMNRIGVPWQGTYGEESTHTFGGIFFVLVGPGVTGPGDNGYDRFIRASLANDDSTWSVVSFHMNQHLMQCGTKPDEAGWGVYEEARRGGAITATGHEHHYSRTHELADVENQVVSNTTNTILLDKDDPVTTGVDEGRSFVFVSGLGGRSIRGQARGGPWWASIYTADQNAKHGALFGVFNYQGVPGLARFYFKNVDGAIVDEFFVRSNL